MSPQGNHDTDPHINANLTYPSHEYDGTPDPPTPPAGIPSGIRVTLVIIGLLILVGIGYRLLQHSTDSRKLERVTLTDATPTVRVIHPSSSGIGHSLDLPGNMQAFDDTPIYARTSGYLKKWFVDIGQHVARGQLMATIETPELDEQLMVARADLQSAQADLNLANTTSERYQNLLKSDSVSKQETDVAVSSAVAKRASVAAAQANVRRLEQLQSFEKIYAPYSGVVTVRNTDIGDLINAGSATANSTAKELFRIATVKKLRVFVAVPEIYAPDVPNGDTATLTLDEYPGQVFSGKVARNSSSIDPASRTLNVEVDIDNSDGKLLPGAYVFVHFKIPQQSRQLSIPANTLLFRSEGLQVGLVQNGHVHLQQVTIGKDDGKTVEIASGLNSNDQVILDPSDSLAEGQAVQIATSTSVAQ
jgi:RND family efflux transporter MFP subunit